MEYPPGENPGTYEGPPPHRGKVPGDQRHRNRRSNVVHMDLDPQNSVYMLRIFFALYNKTDKYVVLVGEVNEQTDHGIMPIMKISDFGLAREIFPLKMAMRYLHSLVFETVKSHRPRMKALLI
jgi:nucleoside-triphosphatase THEP1